MNCKKSIIFFSIVLLNFFSVLSKSAFSQPAEVTYKINSDTLKKINIELRNGVYGKISGIVIFSKSRIIYEQYFGFTNASTIHPISSVTKSVTSLVTGVCVDKGFIKSIDTPVWKYFPEYNSIFEQDTIKKRITIRNLLNQTTGLLWDEWTTHYSYADNALIELSQSNQNWVETILKLPINCSPNNKFCYNSGNSQVIAEILSKATGHDFEWLVNNYIFAPLGIVNYHWDKYPENDVPAWGGISLSTRDMARLGILIANNGRVNDVQIVSNDWIKKSTSIESKNGKADYGLHWWVTKQPDGKPLIYAAGYGDQFVYIAPDKRLVIALKGQNFTDYKWPKNIDQLIKNILSSLE